MVFLFQVVDTGHQDPLADAVQIHTSIMWEQDLKFHPHIFGAVTNFKPDCSKITAFYQSIILIL